LANENIIVEKRGRVGLVTLNRPKAMNALNVALIGELKLALDEFEDEDEIGAIVIIGSDKVFAAGADVKEIRDKSFIEAYSEDFISKD
jgi:enoyl-CoA hydratase|tara:strand:+ start:18 stop:281 length:264 start_codon:yes stop_codon:yes gene_type:complete